LYNLLNTTTTSYILQQLIQFLATVYANGVRVFSKFIQIYFLLMTEYFNLFISHWTLLYFQQNLLIAIQIFHFNYRSYLFSKLLMTQQL